MLGLLPSELWEYGVRDGARGLLAAVSSSRRGAPGMIVVPELGPCIGVRTARVAIVLALRAVGLAEGARVGVPLYCCPVVFKAIVAAGCRPRFLDIDPSTYCLSIPDLIDRRAELDAVIGVHMMGSICDIPRLRDAAPGLPIIEDCAQGLGARLDGRPAGSFGDIAALSFHSGKYVSVGEGGALWTEQDQLRRRLTELAADLPVPTRLQECSHVVNTYLRSSLRTRPLWGLMGERVWKAYGQTVGYASQSPLVRSQIFETDRVTAMRRLVRLKTCVDRQRSIAEYYARTLAVDPGMLCSEPPRAFYNRLQFPLLFRDPEECGRMAAGLREQGISTARPYRNIAAIASAHYGYTGDCPRAEQVASRVMVIPCSHALSPHDVERVATAVNRVWATVGRASAGLAGAVRTPDKTSSS